MGEGTRARAPLFDGPGAARRRCREVDWSATAVGAPEAWSSAVRTAVRLCLNTPVTMAVWAGPEHVLVHNDAYEPVLGDKRAWALGRPAAEVWSEVWSAGLADEFRAVYAGEATHHEGARFVLTRSGYAEEAFFDYTLTPLRDGEGRIVGIVNVLEETTRLVHERVAREELLSFALSTAQMGAWDLDLGDHTARRSIEHERIFGYDELQPTWTFETFLAHVVPADRARVEQSFLGAVASNEAWSFECRVRRRDGEVRWIWAAGRPRRGERGERRVAGIVQDITDRKRHEAQAAVLAAVSDELGRLSTVEEIMRVVGARLGVYLGLATCHFVEVDEEADSALVVGGWHASGIVPEGARRVLSGYLRREARDALRAGRTLIVHDTSLDARVERGSHEDLGVGAFVAVPFQRHGAWRFALSVGTERPRHFHPDDVDLVRDVASRAFPRVERARAEEALRQSQARLEEADRRKDHFLAVLSHELRNPLAPLRNGLYVLERAAPGGPEARRAIAVIGRQVGQLAHLVDDLLDVTRITRNKIELKRARVELGALVARTVDDHRGVFDAAGVDVALREPAAPVALSADAQRVAQIIANLLQNAVKFTPRGGRVEVAVDLDAQGDEAVIDVVDSGAGMSAELLSRLFEPFAQADVTLDRSQGGLGLGLALVRGLVEQHGGRVEASSAGPGLGSRFTVRLPLAEPPRAFTPPPPSGCVLRRRRVLVIDDNRDAADSLEEVLRLDGHDAAVAYDGPTGLAEARAFRPDVVLCDIGLPAMDGYAVARAFRADPSLARVRLVALTGYAQPEDVRRAVEAGFDGHVAKPPDPAKLDRALGTSA